MKPFAAGILIAAIALAPVITAWLARSPEAAAPALRTDANTSADTSGAAAALGAVQRAWLSELERVRELARGVAVNDETYEFVRRPNLPYVDAHFRPERLATLGIDTVLVLDESRRPIFWRRPNDPANEGFPDAERFLAAMPAFAASNAPAGRAEPLLQGAVQFKGGTTLATVLPVVPRSRSAAPRGYVVFGRSLDGAPLRRIAESASVPVDVLAPGDAQLDPRVRQRLGLASGLAPVLIVDPDHVLGFLPLHDVLGRVDRVLAVSLPRETPLVRDAVAPPEPASPWPRLAGATLLLLLFGSVVLWRARSPERTGRRREDRANVERRAEALAREAQATAVPPAAPAGAADALVSVGAEAIGNVERFEDDAATEADAFEYAYEPAAAVNAVPETEPAAPEPAAHTVPTPALRHAQVVRGLIEAGRVSVHYQPQVSAVSGAVVGVEALVRWQDERAVLRSAAELFDDECGPEPFAAATEFVLRRACADRRHWLAQVGRTLPVSVNVGLAELRDPEFLDRVRRILAECDLAPAYLELEVPEAALARAGSVEALALERAHRLGLGVAIGGFVAADAPLRAISNLPVAKLKIDRSLVAQLPRDEHSRTVVDAILAVGRTLGVAVCAEGVETLEQAEYLAHRHCPLMQGWHCGRPMDADRFLDLLKRSGVDTMRLPLMDMEELESHARAASLARTGFA